MTVKFTAAVENAGCSGGRGIGRIRLQDIPDASAARLIPFIEDSIEPGSTVHFSVVEKISDGARRNHRVARSSDFVWHSFVFRRIVLKFRVVVSNHLYL
jgi:hypothetical protein